MRVLVTGGSGVVGTGTVTELLGRGHSVDCSRGTPTRMPGSGRME